MENSNKRGNAAVDDILEELKNKGGQAPVGTAPNVDAILAEMGLGGKKPSPFDKLRPGGPLPSAAPAAGERAASGPVAVVSLQEGAAREASAQAPSAAQQGPQAQAEAPAAAPENAPVLPLVAAQPAPLWEEAEPEAEALAENAPPKAEAPAEQEPEKRKKSPTGAMIWDIEPEHTGMGPRVGKAAALDKVDPDKFVGDSELSRWFGKDNALPTSKRESKKAEKEARRRLLEEQQEARQKAKRAMREAPPEELPEELPEEPAAEDIGAVVAAWSQKTIAQPEERPAPPSALPLPNEAALPAGFEPPKDFAFREKPQRKGFLGRLFGKEDDDEEALAEERGAYAEDEWAEEPAPYEDAFASAFGAEEPAPRRTVRGPAAQQEKPMEPLEADTASFAAIYSPEEERPQAAAAKPEHARKEQAVEADTASFAAAYKRAEAPLAEAPIEEVPLAEASMGIEEDVEPDTAEFAAALGKGPVVRPSRPSSVLPQTRDMLSREKAERVESTDIFAQKDGFSGSPAAGKDDLAKTTIWERPSFDERTKEFSLDGATTIFSAINIEAIDLAAQGQEATQAPGEAETAPGGGTQAFELGEGEEPQRVPTAAFTQEFAADGGAPPEDRSLFLDDMVDDRFRQFFSETVVMDRATEEQMEKARRRRKRTRSAILTGEFARMAELVEQADEAEKTGEELPENDTFDDYDRPQDAPAVEGDIAALRTALTRRAVGTGAIAVLLLWMGLSFSGGLPLPEAVSFAAAPYVFTGIYLVLLLGAIAANFTTVATGLAGLFSAPTVDCAPALAALGGLLQGALLLVQVINGQSAEATLFGALAALVLCFNALGKRVRAVSILRNFQLASAGMDHSAAYTLNSTSELAYNITKGLEEEDPTLLVSRPTALVKGFLRQSFSQRATDRTGRTLGWITLAAALAGTALALIMAGGNSNVFSAVSAFAAVLCIAAPFSSSLVSGVPSLLLQRATARLGAVVPGWSAIEELGGVNVVMATARDIFPPHAVALKGIKTFEKERIDIAILYAASVLIEGCDTLKDIFSGVIQGKNDMLYKVESLVREPGRGFTAWVQNNRVVIGSREMLQKHDVTPPPVELEVKYVPGGHMPVYLAVSGKLFAMFIVGYRADPEVKDTLNGLVKSGVSLLVTSSDMNVTNELIEHAYKLPHGVVKVLGRRELDILEPLTAYAPDSEGVMTHIGSFASFIGGMRSAAGCAAAERMSSIVQLASVILAGALCLLLAFGGGLATLSLSIALLYQAAWTLLVSIMPFMRRY